MRTFIQIFIVTWAAAVSALDTKYSPFSEAEMLRIRATRATSGSGTHSATGKHVAATVVNTASNASCESWEFRIAVDGTNVFAQATDIWMTHTKTIISDLDGNGLEDVAKEVYHGAQGLCLGCDLMIFSQYAPGKFSVITLPSERFTSDDICNLDNKGQREIVTCVLVGCEDHNYWVYRCWHLSGKKLVSVDQKYGFPRAVWFTNKPNHRLVARDLLTKILANYPYIEESVMDEPTLNAERKQSDFKDGAGL